ncbi:hypothetical protein Tco_0435529 [Tanacetum coccineum]
MSASDKFGLGYGDYRYCGILSYENEVMQSVFRCNNSDYENPPLHKRLAKTCEMQAVPPPMTGNYMPSGPDIEIDDSQYTYGPRKTQQSKNESQTTELDTCDSNISTEPSELVSEPVVNESNIEVQPKVWSDAPIIEEYESDSDVECVTVQTEGLDTPSFANKQVKTPREKCLTEIRKPTWNNVQRVNKQNQFVPLAVQTRTGENPVNTAKASSTNSFSTARQNINRQTVLTSTALKVNTVKPIVKLVMLGYMGLTVKSQLVVTGEHQNTTLIILSNTMVDLALEFIQLLKDPMADSSPNKLGFLRELRESSNLHAGQQDSEPKVVTKDKVNEGDSEKEDESDQDCFELPIWHSILSNNN